MSIIIIFQKSSGKGYRVDKVFTYTRGTNNNSLNLFRVLLQLDKAKSYCALSQAPHPTKELISQFMYTWDKNDEF